MIIKLSLSGNFSVNNLIDDDYQCGFGGCKEYRYEVEIKGENVELQPPDYFIIDNNLIDSYFQKNYAENKYNVRCKSCEVMCEEAVEYFKKLISTDGKYNDIDYISVMISGKPDSRIEAVWDNTKEL